MNTKIKDIPLLERPRERLKHYGASTLSNEELLAIILKSGTKEASVKILASKLLSHIGGIQNLTKINYNDITSIKGIGDSKACELLAVVELAKRLNQEIVSLKDIKLTSTSLVYKYYKNILMDKKQEHFYCLYLDSDKKVIENKLIFKGTLNQSLVHPREIFREAYLLSASDIICLHNHPSGNVLPSEEDIIVTERLVEVGRLLGINVIDHIIIGKDNYYSFYENHLIGRKNN
ncbi:MAG: DNA repair protein RadC [Mollicutes bacterium]|nr:DNA repair protein RadC [Mollicutes bacterium]